MEVREGSFDGDFLVGLNGQKRLRKNGKEWT